MIEPACVELPAAAGRLPAEVGRRASALGKALDEERRPRRIAVVIPVYNDWTSFAALLEQFQGEPALEGMSLAIIAVDDGSDHRCDLDLSSKNLRRIERVEILQLACNVGHQRAIAIGLASAAATFEGDGIVVMDADGEDRPADIPRLIAAAGDGEIVCARRAKRARSGTFSISYTLYKIAFRSLSGATLDFGNFCFIPRSALRGLIYSPFVWNHLAAAIVRSRMPFRRIDCYRDARYAGRSRMGFQSLVLHGLSAIAVFGDVALVRLLLATFAIGLATLLGILAVAALRLATELAIPGWATNAAGLLLVFLAQCFVLGTISVFTLLFFRSIPLASPARDALQYIVARDVRYSAAATEARR